MATRSVTTMPDGVSYTTRANGEIVERDKNGKLVDVWEPPTDAEIAEAESSGYTDFYR